LHKFSFSLLFPAKYFRTPARQKVIRGGAKKEKKKEEEEEEEEKSTPDVPDPPPLSISLCYIPVSLLGYFSTL
jgi:hypothetical protein